MNKEYIRELLDSIDVAVVSPFLEDDLEKEIKELIKEIRREININNDNEIINRTLKIIDYNIWSKSYTVKEIYFCTDLIRRLLNKI